MGANSTDVPLYGFPEKFFIIQYTALATIPTTTIISTGVLIYILRPCREFFTKPLADRLIVYMMFCDLCHSLGVTANHVLMTTLRNHPALPICVMLGFLLSEFLLAQALAILYAAMNSFLRVVLHKKMSTGTYDWRLLVFIIGLPTIIGLPGAINEYFGPSGAWCFVQAHTAGGWIMGTFIRCFLISTTLFIALCYIGVWLKIRHASGANGNKKYHKTVRAMFLMVLAYLGQWWAAIVFAIWGMIQPPPFFMLVSNVFFSNLGGLCNFIAYVFIRKMYRKVGNTEETGISTTANNNTSRY